jgi:hypothetical protein
MGYTYERVANEFGWSDKSVARRAVKRALERVPLDTAREAKQLLLIDLWAAKREVWDVLTRGHVVVSNGIVAKIDGTPIPDDDPVLRSVDRLVKIDQEIAKLTGAYEPVRSEVVATDAVDARLIELASEMASMDAGPEAELPEPAGPRGEDQAP